MYTEVALVTGASGFVGSALVLELIQKGYKVKGTVRSQSKADAFSTKYPATKPHLEWSIVPDIVQPGAFDTAVAGVDYIFHTASPLHFDPKDNERDLLQPAVEGTKNILSAAAKQSSVKHVVITSSIAAVLDFSGATPPTHSYSSDDWNPATWEQAVKADNGVFVYASSKTFAEKAAWDFVKSEKPGFYLTTLCPPMLTGPPSQPLESMDDLNASAVETWNIISGTKEKIGPTVLPAWTDIRDVVQMEIAALSNPATRNQRYLTVAGNFTNNQIAHILARAFPTEASRIPPTIDTPEGFFSTDSGKAERDFGIKWMSFEQSVIDTAKELFAREKDIQAHKVVA